MHETLGKDSSQLYFFPWLLNAPETRKGYSQARIYVDDFACCHTGLEVADHRLALSHSHNILSPEQPGTDLTT